MVIFEGRIAIWLFFFLYVWGIDNLAQYKWSCINLYNDDHVSIHGSVRWPTKSNFISWRPGKWKAPCFALPEAEPLKKFIFRQTKIRGKSTFICWIFVLFALIIGWIRTSYYALINFWNTVKFSTTRNANDNFPMIWYYKIKKILKRHVLA